MSNLSNIVVPVMKVGGFALATLGSHVLVGCAREATPLKVARGGASTARSAGGGTDAGSNVAPKTDAPLALTEFSNQEALDYLKESCGSCHEKGQSYQSFWSFEKDKLTAETFSVDPAAYRAYQAIKLKASGVAEASPAPMPPGKATDDMTKASKRFLLWARKAAPDVLLEAHANYPDENAGAELKVVFDFRCEKPVTFRQYLRRVTNDAFERDPLPQELSWAGQSADIPTSKALRDLVAAKFREDANWAAGFKTHTLRKFTDKIASVQEIQPVAGIDQAKVDDLRNEFYELVKKRFASSSWRDILFSREVMATSRTAPLYGEDCVTKNNGSPWFECPLTLPRGSFFTTVGYLLSKRSSFLETNNNYGRAALMNLVLTGELLSAATGGPKGSTEIKPLPACLKTRDYRGTISGDNVSPFGSAKIPTFGNVCQSCHISRHMAAGSILFRPFASDGRVFTPDMIVATNPEVAEAILPKNVHQMPGSDAKTPVDIDFLKSLLTTDGSEQACVVGGTAEVEGGGEIIGTVQALAGRMAPNDRVLAKGLARHIPRALSNLSITTLEIQNRVLDAYEKNGGKLGPVVESYFSSETYACEKRE